MAATGLDVFDKTLHTTNLWLDEISEEIGPDRQLAWHVLGTVLRAIRDAVQVEQSAHLAAQLPLLIRGAYFDQYRPAAQPAAARSHDDFVDRIRNDLEGSRPVNPEQAAAAVMRTLNRHVTAGQIRKVRDALPKGIRALWPESGHDDDSAAGHPQQQPGASDHQPATAHAAPASRTPQGGKPRPAAASSPAAPPPASGTGPEPPAQQQQPVPRHAAPPLSPASGPQSSAHGRWEDIEEAEAEEAEASAFLAKTASPKTASPKTPETSSPGKGPHVPIGAASRPAAAKMHAAPAGGRAAGAATPKRTRGKRKDG